MAVEPRASAGAAVGEVVYSAKGWRKESVPLLALLDFLRSPRRRSSLVEGRQGQLSIGLQFATSRVQLPLPFSKRHARVRPAPSRFSLSVAHLALFRYI